MRVLVCGGREFTDKEYLEKVLDAFNAAIPFECVIEGGAMGADRLAANWAKKNNIENIRFAADWDKYGKAAGPIRNKQMLDEGKPVLVIAFAGHEGTANMIKQAKGANIQVCER